MLRGKEIVRSSVMPDRVLAMSMGGGDASKLDGIPMIEPVFGIGATWIPEDKNAKLKLKVALLLILLPF